MHVFFTPFASVPFSLSFFYSLLVCIRESKRERERERERERGGGGGEGEEEQEQEQEQVRRIMEWENQEHQEQQQQQNGVLYVKVMTDEQMEVLRRQISAYATICEQLVEMHKAITAQQDLSGLRMGNPYCDPLMTTGGHKITSRQRWTPTPLQLQILEHIFDQGNGTPSKQKIKEITNELTQHGPISETNVYNWFQNRRARSKRKQVVTTNNGESEVEMEDDYPIEKKTKSENIQSNENPVLMQDEVCFQSSKINSDLHSLTPHPNKSEAPFTLDGGSKSSGSLGHMSFYESVLSNPRIDHLMDKMEVPGSFNSYRLEEGYDVIG